MEEGRRSPPARRHLRMSWPRACSWAGGAGDRWTDGWGICNKQMTLMFGGGKHLAKKGRREGRKEQGRTESPCEQRGTRPSLTRMSHDRDRPGRTDGRTDHSSALRSAAAFARKKKNIIKRRLWRRDSGGTGGGEAAKGNNADGGGGLGGPI